MKSCASFPQSLTLTVFLNSSIPEKNENQPSRETVQIIYSHDFLPLPILAMLCSLVLVRSFSSGFLLEVHSSVESVSKEMAGAWLGTVLLLSRDMAEVACRTTLPRKECLSSSSSGLLSEYSSTWRTGSWSDLQHVQHAENNTLKI